MAGGPPFSMQSPSPSARFVPYSPTSKSPNYNYEQYQPPPSTPPSFAPATLAQSPRFGHQPATSSPPSGVNGNGQHQSEGTSQYQMSSTSPHYLPQRTFSNHMATINGAHPYGNPPSSHAHPISRQDSIPLSPPHEHFPTMNEPRQTVMNSGEVPSTAKSSRPSTQEVRGF
jgi:chromatin-remodeling ATPase INO80